MTTFRIAAAMLTAVSLSFLAACSDDSGGNLAGSKAMAAEEAPAAADQASEDSTSSISPSETDQPASATFSAMIVDVTAGLSDADAVAAENEISAAVEAGPQTETLAFLAGGYKSVDETVQPALHHAVAKAAWETYRSPAAASQYAADLIHGFGTEKDLESAMEVVMTEEIADNPSVLIQHAAILLDESYAEADRDEAIALLKRAAEGGVEAAERRLGDLGVTM